MLVIVPIGVLMLLLFILGALSPNHPASTDSRSSRGMPEFKGDGHGNATDEDFRKGAEWLLERDQERQRP